MSDINNLENNEELEEIDTVVFEYEDGSEEEFEFIDIIPYNNKEYAILLPLAEDDDDILISEYDCSDPENELYNDVEDDEILAKVYELFKDKYKDKFDFND